MLMLEYQGKKYINNMAVDVLDLCIYRSLLVMMLKAWSGATDVLLENEM